MTIDNLINAIDVRAKYKALGLGELSLTDSELKAQLTNFLNTAIFKAKEIPVTKEVFDYE